MPGTGIEPYFRAQISSRIPATIEPMLASWALVSPRKIFGFRRMNSTRNLAAPVQSRYSAVICPRRRGAPGRLRRYRM